MSELKREGIHQPRDGPAPDITRQVEAKLKMIKRIKEMIPPCPECASQHCDDWFEHYITWIMEEMLGPGGYMEMFIVCLIREFDSIEFTADELKEARRVIKVVAEYPQGDKDKVRARIEERASDDDYEDTEWPTTFS